MVISIKYDDIFSMWLKLLDEQSREGNQNLHRCACYVGPTWDHFNILTLLLAWWSLLYFSCIVLYMMIHPDSTEATTLLTKRATVPGAHLWTIHPSKFPFCLPIAWIGTNPKFARPTISQWIESQKKALYLKVKVDIKNGPWQLLSCLGTWVCEWECTSLTLQCRKKVDIKTLKCIPPLMIAMHLGGSYRPEILYVSQAIAWDLIFNPNIQVYRAYLAPSMINPPHFCSLTPNEFALIPVWHSLALPPLDWSSRKHVSMRFMRRL